LYTPGHTPGHHSLLVKLPQTGPVVLSGDAAHFRENYDSDGVPAFNFDRAQTIASLERIKKIVANTKATFIIQHDARDVGKLPASPESAKYRTLPLPPLRRADEAGCLSRRGASRDGAASAGHDACASARRRRAVGNCLAARR